MTVREKLLGRFASLESDVPQPDDLAIEEPAEGVDDTGAQIDGENIVEGDLVEAADDMAEVDLANAETETLQDTADSLESFLSAAQAARKQGGWSNELATAYTAGIQAAIKPIGLKVSDVSSSLESFNATTERERIEQATSVENAITQALKEIWEAIKRAVNKAIAFVRKWYLKIFDGASRLKKRAEAIRKKADNTKGSAEQSKITTSALAALHINKSMPPATDLIQYINESKDSLQKATAGRMVQGYSAGIDELIAGLRESMEKPETPNAFVFKANIFAHQKDLASTVTGWNKKQIGDSDAFSKDYSDIPNAAGTFGVFQSPELPGGKMGEIAIVTSVDNMKKLKTDEAAKLGELISRRTGIFRFVDYNNKKQEIDSGKEVPILTPADISQIASGVMEFCDVVIDYKKNFENYEKADKKFSSEIEKILKKEYKAEDDAEKVRRDIASASIRTVGNLAKNGNTALTGCINYGMGLSRASLIYCVDSLSKYKSN